MANIWSSGETAGGTMDSNGRIASSAKPAEEKKTETDPSEAVVPNSASATGGGNYDTQEVAMYLAGQDGFLGGSDLEAHTKTIEAIDSGISSGLKNPFNGYTKADSNPHYRATGGYRNSLNNILLKNASPRDIHGISGMPPVFLPNTDPPAVTNSGVKDIVGRHYFRSNIIYATFVAFKPGYVRWDISGQDADSLKEGISPMGIISKAITGTLAYNRANVDQVWRDISRTNRMTAYMMGLNDVAFPFNLSASSQGKQQEKGLFRWIATAGNRSGGKSMKGNWLLASSTQSTNIMTADGYRSIGQMLASLVVNKMESPVMNVADDAGDAGFMAFRVSGNIETQEALNNSTKQSPIKEMIDSTLGMTGDVLGHVMKSTFGEDNIFVGLMTGRAMIPDVWDNSSFQKSYSFEVVLSSPYGNNLSLFLNIYYPISKMIHLALPMGVGGFQTSPPICRVFSAGSINTEFGIISSLTIDRNMKALSDTGMSTEVTLRVTVDDLNPYLYKEKPGWFNKSVELSTGITIFMATIVGQNISTISRNHRRQWNKALIWQEANQWRESIGDRIAYGLADYASDLLTPFMQASDSWSIKLAKVRGTAGHLGASSMASQSSESQARASNAKNFIGNK